MLVQYDTTEIRWSSVAFDADAGPEELEIMINGNAVGGLLFCLAAVPLAGSAQDLEETTIFEVAGDSREVLLMEGTINGDTPAQLSAIFEAEPGIRTIVLLQCLGSSDDEANFPMARDVRARGLNTHLTADSEIYSGCVDFFLAGNARSMEPGARIGVHSWYDDDDAMDGADYPRGSPEHEENRRYVEDMLGSDAFYWFTLDAAPADGMHYLTDPEIARFGLLTR
jgi:hypothetical protein